MAKPSKPDPVLGAVVRRRREARGESLETLGYRADKLTGGALGAIELGRSDPAWSTVRDIAAALEIGVTELVAEVEAERRAS